MKESFLCTQTFTNIIRLLINMIISACTWHLRFNRGQYFLKTDNIVFPLEEDDHW